MATMATVIEVQAASVGQLLKRTRGASGLSTREVAPLVGVSHATVSAWERGAGEPSVSQFIRWAHATGQSAETLLEAVEGMLTVNRSEG